MRGLPGPRTGQTRAAHAHGLDWAQAAASIDLGGYAHLPLVERVAVTVPTVYRTLEPGQPEVPLTTGDADDGPLGKPAAWPKPFFR